MKQWGVTLQKCNRDFEKVQSKVQLSLPLSCTESSALPLNGRAPIITGGSRGIGRAIALHFNSLGARLVINYASNSTHADQLVSLLNSSAAAGAADDGGLPQAIAIKADISDEQQVKTLFDKAEAVFGSIQILVHSAGILDPKYPPIASTTVADWDETFSINTKGAFLCCRAAINRFARGGRIIMISTSLVGGLQPGYGAYTASKAAVETMIKIAAKELKGRGVTANCVAPGPTATELFFQGKSEETINRMVDLCPLGRLGQTHDLTPIVGLIASDAGEWINGQVIRVNGGAIV
uniref:Uncharacterized protein n=1 Tax=Kalanchoe fedtschenkoi TaxID=63787 RepID=A0A7N0VKQ5_KALFE